MQNKKAFTLVELIVTITILAILGTIGFLSFQSYTVYSRDVVRLSHISNMKSVLEYNYTETGRYPKPDGENNITYSGAIAWIQGDFGKDTKRKTKRLDSIPLDPLTQNTYSYSVTKNQSEFELGSIFEGDEISKNNNILNSSYADNSDFKAYISGNYNGQILKVKSGSVDYILAVPSIILSDYTDLKLEDIIDNANSKFVLNGYNNIPSNYGMTNSGSGELDFLKKENFVVFEGNLEALSESGSLQEELGTKLALAYSGTTIENNSGIKEIVNAHSGNKLYLTQNIIKSTLIPKFEITAVSVTNGCASQPNYANANFVAGTPANQNISWQNVDSNEACYYSCENSYTGSDCGTAPVYASCKEILDNGAGNIDGVYTIDPDSDGTGFDVYCDMTTDGGGWTALFYGKSDLNYINNFGTINNTGYLKFDSDENNDYVFAAKGQGITLEINFNNIPSFKDVRVKGSYNNYDWNSCSTKRILLGGSYEVLKILDSDCSGSPRSHSAKYFSLSSSSYNNVNYGNSGGGYGIGTTSFYNVGTTYYNSIILTDYHLDSGDPSDNYNGFWRYLYIR